MRLSSVDSGIPMGLPWEKEDMKPAIGANTLFLLSYEEREETKNVVKIR
jgi:hypothetical protein